jgi:transcriptional regulator with XRE-family HTH domain
VTREHNTISRDADIGGKIRSYRKRRKFSLNRLSALTGIAASNLSSIELGKTSPTLGTLVKIAAVFEMRVSEFLDETLYPKCTVLESSLSMALASGAARKDLTAGVTGSKLKAHMIGITRPNPHRVSIREDTFLMCLQGSLSVCADEETFTLNPGASLYCRPWVEIRLECASDLPVTAVLVMCAG